MFFEQVNYGAQFLSLRTILRTNSWLACSIYAEVVQRLIDIAV